MRHSDARIRNAEIAQRGGNGERIDALASEYGLTVQYVYMLLRTQGVKRPKISNPTPDQCTPTKARVFKRRAVIRELHDLGLSAGVAKRLMGMSAAFYAEARGLGLKFPYDSRQVSASGRRRAAKMAAMYRAGMTLQQIGDRYGITRERVRQLMTKYEGMDQSGGGAYVKGKANKQRMHSERNARYLEKYGCTFDQYREVRELGRQMVKNGFGIYQTPLRAFINQKNNAKQRGIGWQLTFWQWWTLWQESGKWNERGLRRDGYVMSRFMDQGDYRLGNTYIGTLSENSSVQPNNPYRKDHPDHAQVMVAVTAKRRKRERTGATDAHTKNIGLPRGVTLHHSGRYMAQASIDGKRIYLGMHATPEAGHAAYLRATGQVESSDQNNSEAA